MNDLAALELRLRTLEARQRRLRFLGAGSLALWVVSCLAAVAAPEHDELRARRFVLVDEHGAERGRLSTEGGPSLALWTGERGAPEESTTLAAGKNGGLSITGADQRVELGLAEEPGTGLRLECGTASAMLLMEEAGAVLSLEHDPHEETFSVLELGAIERGAWITGSWSDRYNFDLGAEHDASRLLLSQPNPNYQPDEESEVELRAGAEAGSLTLRHDGQPSFRAPQ